ncbi:MAG: hypothetical protein OXS29_03080 [bacterium]|nr:hypothetical protein [bacterium]MDE0290539.1 hypothetical protein [bacterium]MDE0436936.1 hypothetical protein [bacterium]
MGDVISGAEPVQQSVRLGYMHTETVRIHTETVREIGCSDAFGVVHEHFQDAKSIDTRRLSTPGRLVTVREAAARHHVTPVVYAARTTPDLTEQIGQIH